MKWKFEYNIFNREGTNWASMMMLVCWGMLAVQIGAFYELSGINSFGLGFNVFIAAVDAAVAISPFILLKPRWRWSIIVPMVLVPIYLYANLLYYRNFNDMMGFSTMFGVQNATGVVADSAFSSVRLGDLWIGVPFVVSILFYIALIKRVSVKSFSRNQKIAVVLTALVLFISQQLTLQAKMWTFVTKGNKEFSLNVHKGILKNFFPHYNRSMTLRFYGFPAYWTFETIGEIKPVHRLDKKEIAEIDRIFDSRKEYPLIIDSVPDNSKKNLIIIVVESFNSDGLYVKVNGGSAMPYLSRLIKGEGVFVADNICSQVGLGRSSDGRFIIHTGLLPTLNNPVAMTYPDEHYPSIADALGRDAYEFDCANPVQWNKVRLSKSYGFQKLYPEKEMVRNMKKLGGKDVALFNNALRIIKNMRQPFVAALNTMDMHDPYDGFGWKKSDVWQDPTLTVNEKVYVEKLRQFDAGLSQFVKGLKDANLYDSSVIVIVADHNARESALLANKFKSHSIPLIILNSGLDIKTHLAVGQIDVFPTILDVIGVHNYRWRGFGTSILRNPRLTTSDLKTYDRISDPYSYPSRYDWELSECMITGGYFKE